jgi:hypothetical protein
MPIDASSCLPSALQAFNIHILAEWFWPRRDAQKEARMLKNERGYFLDNSELLQKLGCGSRLPEGGFDPVEVEGVMFICEPPNSVMGRKRSRHRLRYFCKACRIWVPCGRAGQHNRGKEHKAHQETVS